MASITPKMCDRGLICQFEIVTFWFKFTHQGWISAHVNSLILWTHCPSRAILQPAYVTFTIMCMIIVNYDGLVMSAKLNLGVMLHGANATNICTTIMLGPWINPILSMMSRHFKSSRCSISFTTPICRLNDDVQAECQINWIWSRNCSSSTEGFYMAGTCLKIS